MLLIYISIERIVTTLRPMKKLLFRSEKRQITYVLAIICFNMIYYTPFIQTKIANTNHTKECVFEDINKEIILKVMDFLNRVAMPCILLIMLTLLLLYLSVKFKSKKVLRSSFVTAILLNCSYLFLTLPLTIFLTFDISSTNVYIALILFYSNYGLGFYIIYFSNARFRDELFKSKTNNIRRIDNSIMTYL